MSVFGKFVTALAQVAGGILAFCLCATIALTDPPAKPKNPGPLDIPDSQVLKMSIDQYIATYEKKHNGNINEPETRALCYYYAQLSRDRNLRLARRLSPSKSKLVTRCQKVFDDLSMACNEYQYDTMGGTIISDFYASLDVENESAMHHVVDDLRISHRSNLAARHRSNLVYLAAWKSVRKSRSLLSASDPSAWSTNKERLADYHRVERTLREARITMNSLPNSAKPDFAAQLKEIVDTLNSES